MSIYKQYSPDQIEELLSNYLISAWSFSSVATFSRNEKEFEKTWIYGERGKNSSTSISGSAYHKALQLFFSAIAIGKSVDIVAAQKSAYDYIDSVKPNLVKLTKTTPTVEDALAKATSVATSLLENFYAEKSIYMDEIQDVIGVELRLTEWVNVNGVDIPMPCIAVIDLVVRLKDGKTVIIDHKSKTAYTDEKEVALSIGKQAITYVKCYESATGEKIDEVWFVENKPSKNKDKSPQLLKHRIQLDESTRKLYEVLLYEPLKKMIEAVSNPDYIYMINDSDNIADKAELYEFWCRTLISEVDDFINIQEDKKDLVSKRLRKIKDSSIDSINPRVISFFKKNASEFIKYDFSNKDMTNSEKITHMLRSFGKITNVAYHIEGYSSDTYLLEASAGVRMADISKHRMDIANALDVSSVRIGTDLLVYEDSKSYLYIESPRKERRFLSFDPSKLDGMKIPIGVDNFGRTVVWNMDNHSTPHMLICGSTGSGKSVSIISTIEYAKLAGVEDIVIFDPKYEFCEYSSKNIRVYNEIEDIEENMLQLVEDMQRRARGGVNRKTLIIFDEFSDAVQASRSGSELDVREEVQVGYYAPKKGPFGFPTDPEPKYEVRVVGRLKSLEENLKIILQKGRSLGFRVIAATQRASTKVITGDAKVNFPVLVCFRVPKEVDSKVVIDEVGAETLCGMGDGLIKSPEYNGVVRFQGFYKK